MNTLRNQLKKNNWNIDILNLYVFFFISIGAVYIAPKVVSVLVQLTFLIVFYKSNKSYFWLAFLIIVQSSPGFLFDQGDSTHTLALLRDSPVGNLYFWILFLVAAVVKSINLKPRYRSLFIVNIVALGGYLIILLIPFGVHKVFTVFRLLLPWSFLFILPRLLKSSDDYARFFNLLFAFVFFVLLTQFYKIFTGLEFSTLFGGTVSSVIGSKGIEETGSAVRPVFGIYIPFLSLWGSAYYLSIKKQYFSNTSLYVILGLSIFSIFLTATRSWLIVVLFISTVLFFLVSKNPFRIFSRLIIPALVIFIITLSVPFLRKQVDLAVDRYETMELLFQGDITAGGTVKRFDVRGPRVMNKFYESPLVGWGFGTEAAKYSDGHVGHHNLLMHTGIIGYGLFAALWINFVFKLFRRFKAMNRKNPYRTTPIILMAFLLAILILHTTVQWFNYPVTFMTGFSICLLFSLASFTYWESWRIDCQLDREAAAKSRLRSITPADPAELQ